jgi:hypothetical protein
VADFADIRVIPRETTVRGLALAAPAGGFVAVSIVGQVVSCRVARGLSVAANDAVLVLKEGPNRWVYSVLFPAALVAGSAEDTDPVPSPQSETVTDTLVCAPVETRSRRDGKWRTDVDDVRQGQYGGNGNHTGCAFYGSKPRSLKGAVVTKALLRVKRIQGGDFAARTATLRLVTEKTRPSGAPTLTSSTTGPKLAVGKSTTSFVVPTSWAQAMVDGTAGGLAVFQSDGSPYMSLAGRSSWGQAFTLSITWKRS